MLVRGDQGVRLEFSHQIQPPVPGPTQEFPLFSAGFNPTRVEIAGHQERMDTGFSLSPPTARLIPGQGNAGGRSHKPLKGGEGRGWVSNPILCPLQSTTVGAKGYPNTLTPWRPNLKSHEKQVGKISKPAIFPDDEGTENLPPSLSLFLAKAHRQQWTEWHSSPTVSASRKQVSNTME